MAESARALPMGRDDIGCEDDGDLLALWQTQVALHGAETALITGERGWRYAELDAWSTNLAERLRRAGVLAGDLVVVHGERGAAAIAAWLAILKCAACYLPIEPDLPMARRDFILADARPKAVIRCSDDLPFLSSALPQVCALEALAAPTAVCRASPAAPGQALYLLYTSGSSGRPKGVIGTQCGLLNRLRWMWREYPYGDDERVAYRTRLGFVDAVAEVWGALLGGVPLVLATPQHMADVDQFIALIESQRVSRLVLVPSLLRTVLAAEPALGRRWSALRLCISSGEVMPADLARTARQALPQCRLLNLYGMTEGAADATAYEIGAHPTAQAIPDKIPIGRTIPGMRVSLLNANGVPTAPGEVGEIHLGGVGLALGYYRRPGLTAACFVPDPDPAYAGERLYATGDLGRINTAGELEYHGRRDQQVKVRGHRIELSELEHHTRAHPSVAHCAAMAPDSGVGAGELLLFVAVHDDSELTPAALRAFLGQSLPPYMVPGMIDIRAQWPLLHNGKTDRHALLATMAPAHEQGEAPTGAVERRIALIWQEVLRSAAPARQSDFFSLGGNSLTAALVVSRLRTEFKLSLSMAEFFDCADLAALAERVERRAQVERLRAEQSHATDDDDDTCEVVEF